MQVFDRGGRAVRYNWQGSRGRRRKAITCRLSCERGRQEGQELWRWSVLQPAGKPERQWLDQPSWKARVGI